MRDELLEYAQEAREIGARKLALEFEAFARVAEEKGHQIPSDFENMGIDIYIAKENLAEIIENAQ